MVRAACEMDRAHGKADQAYVLRQGRNYRANRLYCDAADRAMQLHRGMGYSRHKPFEQIYRHHRRYRITEGSKEIEMRKWQDFYSAIWMGGRSQSNREMAASGGLFNALLSPEYGPTGTN
jgi:hypothetical protein